MTGPDRDEEAAPAEGALVVSRSLVIPPTELRVRVSRAGGPGGQHVNTSSTRVELLWDLAGSGAVSDAQRRLLQEKLAGRLDAEGNVRIVSSESRSQRQNRDAAEERLADLVRGALTPRKARRPTKRPRRANEARLADKKKRGDRKRERRDGEGA
jgi:ribosome-associated protein